ncbi:MAG: DUF4145 domain-containing protein [Lacrimispora sp.]|uniref:SH3 domain-containing protein n=1 Tax=Lacrimispora sp. TaxID=2719234 RepID=UPI0039E3D5DA
MGTADNSFWARVQQGLRETETLMSQKQHNMSMIKARQTLEYIVNFLGERALIVEGDLADSIDQLFEGRFISQDTRDHYHRIRMLGNKAVHEGDDSPYDASEACQLLAQEVKALGGLMGLGRQSAPPMSHQPGAVSTVPITSRNAPSRRAPGSEAPKAAAPRNAAARPASQRTGERPSGTRPSGSRQPASRSSQRPSQRSVSRNGQRISSQSRSRRRSRNRGFDPYDLLKPALIFLALLVVVMIFVKLVPGKGDKKETTASQTPTEISTESMLPTETPPETAAPSTEAPKIYTTSSKLNVRSEPSTESTRLGSLASGTVVDYVETYDDKWTVIMFEGKQAYVATEFLTVSEAESEETGETSPVSESSSRSTP